MRNPILVALLSISTTVLLAASTKAAAPVSGPIVNPDNGHTYYLLGSDTWAGSEASAKAIGGHLATVRNSVENAWIYDTFTPTSQHNLWIGLSDPTFDALGGSHDSNFAWADGETSTYRNWASGEPNNNNGGEYWTLLQYQTFNLVQPLQWNDVTNDQGICFAVAEIVPEPVGLAFIAIGAAASMRRRRSSQAA